ncbi:MAG: DUF3127 domain-containing protein [Planctomycetota bacterium]
MSEGVVQGKVHVIEDTKTYGQNGFRKRLLVLEQETGRFTNFVPLEFVQDACDTIDGLSIGEQVEVRYRLNGRKWQKDANSEVKFFLNAEALSYKVLSGSEESSSAPVVDEEPPIYEDGDIPF